MNARTAVLAALVSVSVAACATAGSSSVPSPGSSGGNGLDGRTFLSTSIDGRTLVAGSRVRLAFSDGSVTANTGCNTMSGAWAVKDNRLSVGQMATTEMGCSEALMAQDEWLAGLLHDASIVLSGDTLRLGSGGVTLTLTDRVVADPDRPLAGSRWILESIVSGETVSSVPAGVTASLVFASGTVSIQTGCNGGSGSATIGQGTITFGAISLTKIACQGDTAAVESAVTAVLRGEVAWSIEASTLTLGPAGHQLMFSAEAKPSASA